MGQLSETVMGGAARKFSLARGAGRSLGHCCQQWSCQRGRCTLTRPYAGLSLGSVASTCTGRGPGLRVGKIED